MISGFSSSLHISNCCVFFMAAHKFVSSGPEKKAFDFEASKFLLLCESDRFHALVVEAFEKVVLCHTLKVRSELDVLRAIINWSKMYSAKDNDKEYSPSESTFTEIAEKLSHHLRVDQIDPAQLCEVGKIALEADLGSLMNSCSRKLFSMIYLTRSL